MIDVNGYLISLKPDQAELRNVLPGDVYPVVIEVYFHH